MCIYESIRIRIGWNQKRKRKIWYFGNCTDMVAEWLRRWTANPGVGRLVSVRGFGSHLCRNFLLTEQNLSTGYLPSFLSKISTSVSKKRYQDRKKTTGVNLWKECIYGWIGNRIDYKQKRKRNDSSRAWFRIRSLSTFSINKKKLTRVYLSIFLLKKFFINFQINIQDR